MTGSLQIKNGKYYAVLNYKNEDGKRKQKWICTELEIKGNKRKAEVFLQKALVQYEDFSEIKTDILFSEYISKWLLSIKGQIEVSTLVYWSSPPYSEVSLLATAADQL